MKVDNKLLNKLLKTDPERDRKIKEYLDPKMDARKQREKEKKKKLKR